MINNKELFDKQFKYINEKFVKKEVAEEIYKKAVTETIDAVIKWIEEHTDIIDNETGNMLPHAAITQRETAPDIAKYVFQTLENKIKK